MRRLGFALAMRVLNTIIVLFITVLAARLLSVEDFAIYSVLLSGSLVLATIMTGGFDQSLVPLISYPPRQRPVRISDPILCASKCLSVWLPIWTLIGTTIYFPSLLDLASLNSLTLTWWGRLSVAVYSLGIALRLIGASIMRTGGSHIYAAMLDGPLGGSIALCLIGVLGLLADAINVNSLFLCLAVGNATIGASSVVISLRRYRRRMSFTDGQNSALAVAIYSSPMMTTTLLTWLSGAILLSCVSRWLDSYAASVFALGLQIVTGVSVLFVAAQVVFGPQLARSWQDGAHALEPFVRVAATLSSAPGVFATIGLIAVGTPLVPIVFGHDYAGAAPLLTIFAGGRALQMSIGPSHTVLNVTGHQFAYLRLQPIIAILYVVFPATGAAIDSLRGAVIGFAVGLVVQNLLLSFLVWWLIGVRTYATLDRADILRCLRSLR